MWLKGFIIGLTIFLGICLPILGTDLYWQWIPFLSHTQEYPIKLSALFIATSAFITLLLALTAVRTIEESNIREKQRRRDELSKQRRERLVRTLDEIIGWVDEISEVEYPIDVIANLMIKDPVSERLVILANLNKLINSFRTVLGKGLYPVTIVTALDDPLKVAVEELMEKLKRHLDILVNCHDAALNSKFDEYAEALKSNKEHWKELDRSSQKVIEEACAAKINALNI